MLAGALGAGHCIFPEHIHPLPAEYRMVISSSQCISNPVPAVLRLAVYRISSNAESFIFLGYQRHIVAPSTVSGRHGWSDSMRSSVACVNSMVFEQYRLIVAAHSGGRSDGWTNPNPHFCTALLGSKYQRLVAMLLCPECPGNIFTADHNAAALIVEAQDGWHHITAG